MHSVTTGISRRECLNTILSRWRSKNIRFFYIEDDNIKEEHVANYFGKIGEVTDPETGLTTWYSDSGKRVEFNDKGIAAFNEKGRLSDVFEFSNVIWKRVEFDFLNTVYQRLFSKSPKEKQKIGK